MLFLVFCQIKKGHCLCLLFFNIKKEKLLTQKDDIYETVDLISKLAR